LGLAPPGPNDVEPSPRTVIFCSTTAPFTDRDDAVMLAGALDLPESAETLNLGASLRAATRALITAARMIDAPRPDDGARRDDAARPEDAAQPDDPARILLVASDARITRAGSAEELSYGDAAAALLVGPSHPGALATILGAHSVGSDFVDHYRMSDSSFDYALEERWVRDESLMKLIPRVVSALLAESGFRADTVAHLILPASAGTTTRIAQACGLGAAQRDTSVLADCGNAGVALPLLMLAATLEAAQPGELIMVLGIGQGVDALLLRVQEGVRRGHRPLQQSLARRCEEPSYTRYLSHRGLLEVDFGMRAERDQRTAHTVAYRKRDAILGFNGGRCGPCGTVQFPQSRVCVNPACRATDSQSPYRLADSTGRIKTFTEDWQAYAARPPYIYGNVEFAEGGNLLMEFTDVDGGELQVNDAVRFVFRIKDDDRARGFRRYFWKAAKA
jgi:3-hydroxy-3-methylglutaryl CoA synthase